jgi:branched-chain amino acid transport system ATP-binding protein
LEHFTALENVMVGALFGQGQDLAHAREYSREICDLISLRNYDRSIDNLTVLDLKKIEIGRAMASNPDLLFLDELMAGLNADETAEMIQVVRELQKKQLTIIVVEHIMPVVRELTERRIVLDGGAIIAEGSFDEVATNERVIEAYLGKEE